MQLSDRLHLGLVWGGGDLANTQGSRPDPHLPAPDNVLAGADRVANRTNSGRSAADLPRRAESLGERLLRQPVQPLSRLGQCLDRTAAD